MLDFAQSNLYSSATFSLEIMVLSKGNGAKISNASLTPTRRVISGVYNNNNNNNNNNGLLWIALRPEAKLLLKHTSYAKGDMHYDKYVKLKCGEWNVGLT